MYDYMYGGMIYIFIYLANTNLWAGWIGTQDQEPN